MHVLTKIFIVLVSLLSVLLVPLVVVYAHNEDSYKAKFQAEQAQRLAATNSLQQAQTNHSAALSRLEAQLLEVGRQSSDLQQERDSLQAEMRAVQAELATEEAAQGAINAKLATLSEANRANSELAASLVDDLRKQRETALQAEEAVVQMEQQYREAQASYEVADAARRALQEEVQQLKEDIASAVDTVGRYVAMVGALPDSGAFGSDEIIPDRNVTAVVTNVTYSQNVTYADINVGSRDGVKAGWVMTISQDGAYVGNLRITDVDINISTGIVELAKTSVTAGQKVTARAGG